jgi:hypothetical protein
MTAHSTNRSARPERRAETAGAAAAARHMIAKPTRRCESLPNPADLGWDQGAGGALGNIALDSDESFAGICGTHRARSAGYCDELMRSAFNRLQETLWMSQGAHSMSVHGSAVLEPLHVPSCPAELPSDGLRGTSRSFMNIGEGRAVHQFRACPCGRHQGVLTGVPA